MSPTLSEIERETLRPLNRLPRPSPVVGALGLIAYVARLNAAGTFPSLAKIVVGGTVAMLALVAPAAILTSSVAGAYGNGTRIDAAGFDLSLADALLAMAVIAAVPYIPTSNMLLRRMLAVTCAFELILAASVVAHPTQRAIFELGHRIILVPGAILVGVVLGRTTALTNAIRLFYLASFAVAVDAIRKAAINSFAPAYPFNMHKNSAGLILAFAFLLLFVLPRLGAVPPEFRRALIVVTFLGIIATRSRASMVAILPVTFVWMVRSGRMQRLLPATLVAGSLLIGVVYVTTESELADPSTSGFSGIATREDTNSVTLELWRSNPIFGAGLRYFRDPDVLAAQPPGFVLEPHNVVLAALAEGGVVGALALVVLVAGSYVVLRPLRSDFAFFAQCAIAVRIFSGLFDIFWVAGTGSLPWIFVGLAIGVNASAMRTPEEVVA